MKVHLPAIFLIFVSTMTIVSAEVSTLERQLILEWLATTVGQPWNISTDPCTWQDFVCDPQQTTVEGITVNIPSITLSTGVIMYGGLPDLPTWAAAKANGTAFTKLRYVNLLDYRSGPIFPDWAEDFWTNYNDTNPRSPFNFFIDCHYATSFICLPKNVSSTGFPPNFQWSPSRNVSCTNINVVTLIPDHGPSTGGTSVLVKANSPLGYSQIFCSFGSEDGYSPLVPAESVFFYGYPWADYNNATYAVIPFSLSVIQCISPPHPPGEVTLRIFTAGISITNEQIMKYSYECKPGTYGSAEDCLPCAPGTWSSGATKSCYPCQPGTYSEGWGNTGCTSCLLGTYSNEIGATNMSNCLPCEAGTIGTMVGATSCEQCQPGSYSIGTGNSLCQTCEAGYYQSNYGNSSCVQCPAGSWNDQTGAAECYYCAVGSYTSSPGHTSCINCPPGSSTEDLGATQCTPCSAGWYRPAEGFLCLPCSPGRYSNSTGQVLCKLCEKGTWNAAWNSSECLQCPTGTRTVNKGSTGCYAIASPEKAPQEDQTWLIVGIVLLVLAIIFILGAVTHVILKRHEQRKRQLEVDAIRAIMDGTA